MNDLSVNVLLVEDDLAFARAAREGLGNSGSMPINVVNCRRLSEALELLKSESRVHAALLDLVLPDCQGLETFARFQRQAQSVPVIILTECDDEQLGLEAVRQGAQDYLVKGDCIHRILPRVVRYAIERERAKEQLREREEFFRLISENVSDLIAVIDPNGRRLYNNASYKELLGDPAAAQGSNSLAEVHRDDRERIQGVLRETLATGVGQRAEYRFVLKNGGIRFVESQGNVINDASGKVSKVVVVSRDITDRKEGEEALRQSEQRYKQLLASTTDYVFTVTVEKGNSLRTTYGAGSLALTGYTPGEYGADPQLWLRVVPKADQDAVLAHAAKISQSETPPPLEHRLIHKNGGIRWIRHTSIPRKDAQGRVVAYDGLISDITERKQAEERLKELCAELAQSEESLRKSLSDLKASGEALKSTELELIEAAKMESIGTLTAGVAHEVKNPLQTVSLGLAYIANYMPRGNENVMTALNDMRDAVARANSIVGELLQFSGTRQLEMKEQDLNIVVERSLSLMNYELTAAQIAVVRELAAGLPLVKIAGSKIEQVFLNLFINAIQAMSPGGTLTVRTRVARLADDLAANGRVGCPFKAGEQIVIAEVQDTGVGIPETNLPKVFDPFFTTKPAGIGTGLGLSVIKKIVDLHGGSVDLQNSPQGGVKVTLMLKSASGGDGVNRPVGDPVGLT